MRIIGLLQGKKKALLDKWFELICKTYPDRTVKFLSSVNDQFANPVGQSYRECAEGVIENLLAEADSEAFRPILEKSIKIRAVQDISAPQAVGFIFFLKTVIRETLKKELKDPSLYPELLEIESRIDGLSLIGFDLYVQSRMKVYEIRASELRDRTRKFMERLQRMTDAEKASPEDNEA